jgi:uncharacterized protein (TIGR02147 family)
MDDFRTYVRSWVETQGRGEFRRISLALNMHTTLVSQIFRGRKCLTEEQAATLCSYMGLNALETDYFLTLVLLERAGSDGLKIIFRRHLRQIQDQVREVRSRIPDSKTMGKRESAIFYSSWQYGVVRLLTSLKGFQTVGEIASYLELSVSRATEILEFLASQGLCERNGQKYIRTAQNTHIEARSPLSIRHHQNWRAKSIALQEEIDPSDLAFTSSIALATKDREKVRQILMNAIAEVSNIIEKSQPEEIAYLGIDWFQL